MARSIWIFRWAIVAATPSACLCACLPNGGAPAATPPAGPRPVSSVPSDPFAADEARARTPVEVVATPHGPPVLLQHATVLTATGQHFSPGYVLMESGAIVAVGEGDGPTPPREGTVVIEARGKFITPGIVDPHSHMGVYPVPQTEGHDDGNETTDPITAGLRAEHSFWPQDPALERAVAGGVTTIGVLPGSANLIGGRGAVI
ncbi:MAG TPA: hypothetical protein VIF15_03900, partial [Polyangiaceae bacterium]